MELKDLYRGYWIQGYGVSVIIEMSLKANVAIILHLHQFKNLALPHKARFAMRAVIYQGNEIKNYAMPFNIIETETKPRRNVSKESQIEDNSFCSKNFNIEYQEQDIELNDCCEFRLSLDAFPSLRDDNIYLEFILVENPTCYFREQINSKVELKEVEQYRFKLQNISTGIFRYCEGEFSQVYIASFSFSLFLMVTDYRFHPYTNPVKAETSKEKSREKVDSIQGLMQWGQKYVKNCDKPERYFYENYVKNLRYNSSCFQVEVNGLFRIGQEELKLRAPIGEEGQLIPVNEKQFFQYVSNYFPPNINEQQLMKQIYKINEQNFYFLMKVSKQISQRAIDTKRLKDMYRTERKDIFGERVFRSIVFGKEPKDKEANTKIASKMRKKRKINQFKIVDEYLFMHKKNQHYAFLQVNLPLILKTEEFENESIEQVLKELSDLRQAKLKQKFNYDERNMLVILVHGFQASSYDMQLIKRELTKMLPVGMFLISSCNQINTEGDIGLMGFKLSQEIKSFITRTADNESEVILNFVGHSMGGVIARSCLKYLQKYDKQLGFFLSLSTPHLGYLNGVDTMIKTGLWFMRKMNKTKSLDQLTMEDSEKLRQTFLFKLSETGHLRSFKKVILISSSEDSYVPWHSARIQYPKSSNSSSKVEKQMIENILGDQIVHRIDVHFDIDTKDMDSFIGRTAHINLLTHECLFKLITEAIPNLLDIRQI